MIKEYDMTSHKKYLKKPQKQKREEAITAAKDTSNNVLNVVPIQLPNIKVINNEPNVKEGEK